MSELLIESVSPNGNLQAFAESTDEVCFLYMQGAPELDFGMKAVWVRNHVEAPLDIDPESMKAGKPPLNPMANCRHPEGLPIPEKEKLEIVWIPEGNGAALYEGDELLAMIPPWSGTNGFDGYARDCIGEGVLAWEIAEENEMAGRFEKARDYWRSWDSENDPWQQYQPVIDELEVSLGKHSNYYAIDGGYWPPKAMLRIPCDEMTILVTAGVGMRPQPNVEMSTETPEQYRRFELAVALPKNQSEDRIQFFGEYISGQTNIPWQNLTWLGHGHTLPCDRWMDSNRYPFAVLTKHHPAISKEMQSTFDGDPINLIWLLPITEDERKLAMDQGTEALLKQLPQERWLES